MPFGFEFQTGFDVVGLPPSIAAVSDALMAVSNNLPELAGEDVWLTLRLVSLDEICYLHAQYFDDHSPTDIITFPAEMEAPSDNDAPWASENSGLAVGVDGTRYLGDIAVCLDIAREQAVDAGHSLERELAFLALHGLLHLLGYDDRSSSDRDAMLGRQEALLVAAEQEVGRL